MAMQVVAALIYREARLLVCQRRKNGPFPLKWEFPGGKVERGEDYFAALRRELREELGIELQSATEFFRHRHRYADGDEVDLIFFRIDAYQDPIENRVFQQIRWVEVRRLKEIDFLEGDLPLIEQLVRQG